MAFFYAFDEYTDVRTEDEVQNLADIVMDAMRNPDKTRPEGENPLGEVARQ